VKRVLSVLTVALLMAAMMLAMAMPAFAQVKRGTCLEGIPCSQGVLLPDEPVGNVIEEGFGQASSACPSLMAAPANPHAAPPHGGTSSENQTIAFFHCFVGPEPIE
jgi:hypothetical protein